MYKHLDTLQLFCIKPYDLKFIVLQNSIAYNHVEYVHFKNDFTVVYYI